MSILELDFLFAGFSGICATYCTLSESVLSRVMRKYNSVTYEVGKAKAEQAAGMFGLAAD